MKSIRGQLTFALCLLAAVLLPLAGLAIYWTERGLLLAQFDESLKARAEVLISGIEVDDGELEMDSELEEFVGIGSGVGSDVFAVFDSSGRVLLSSGSGTRKAQWEVPSNVGEGGVYQFFKLADGREMRGMWRTFLPEDEDGEMGMMVLLVASPGAALVGTLGTLATVMTVSGGVGLLVAVLVLQMVLKRGFRSLERMGTKVQQMKVGQPGQQLDLEPLPVELRGMGAKVNELLERVEVSLARERRFSSHAAHELRTPLAELRAMGELIATWPEERTKERSEEMMEVVREMEVLLDKLSLLARADAGAQSVKIERVNLRELVESTVDRHRAKAEQRKLLMKMEWQDEEMETDAVLYGAILNNLVGNAVSHAPMGSAVSIEVSAERLVVGNPAPALMETDLSMLFERFWRKNTARTDGAHSGLGLSIVKACAELLGGRCEAVLEEGGDLKLMVRWKNGNEKGRS
ncbi:hypothetical protein FEM03_03555 [Phragmitibacter flavus]|uniref:histidine kinase n=1 Tax=Phragmitibacter flavus TaxID=2576071 RepID=A0A5R8KJH8_9BACT|nr:ATP-binding protein [Phragmitibacter flavus]TLD72442.1 hypothetical protein FEM03_03555 [Phragmitibacter flavus]